MKKTLIALLVICVAAAAPAAFAKGRPDLDHDVSKAVKKFYEISPSGKELAQKAKGMLVFPSIVKAGIGIGGEYGKGSLLVNGRTVGYYSTTSGSIGFQLGAQKRTQMLLFMTNKALSDFRKSDGWEVGVDGSVVLIDLGAGADVDTNSAKAPIIGVVFGNKGLMYNLSLEGTKISRIHD